MITHTGKHLLTIHTRCTAVTLRTVTSFASYFNGKKNNFLNLLKNTSTLSSTDPSTKKTGLFGHDILKDPSGFLLFREDAKFEAENLVREALDPNRTRKMVQVFDNLSNCLCRVADLAEFVRIGHPNERFAASAEEASLAISVEVERLNTHKQLYDVLKSVVDSGDSTATTPLDDFVAKLFLFDFEQSGIHLDEEKRRQVVQLNEYILQLGAIFFHSTSAKRSILKSKLPREIRSCFPSDGDSVTVSGLFADSENAILREAAYKVYLAPDDQQNNLLTNLLLARRQLANLCGFRSYAERAIRGSIAETPEYVLKFLNLVSSGIKDYANQDYQKMLQLKQNYTHISAQLHPWDVPYYTAAYKSSRYSQDILMCAPYFSLGACMNGIDLIFGQLFDIKLQVSQADAGETWSPDVIKLSVLCSNTHKLLGVIYCDFFERPGKSHQDCHFTIQGGCCLPNGSYQIPIVVLMLSLSRSQPSLLSPHQVDNLFHEMGHAIHSMIARTPYQHITGTRCSTDLAEVPSILMEYFASDPRILKKFARHHISGETIPSDLLASWIESKRVFNAADTQLQIFYSMLDQVYHSDDPLHGKSDTTGVISEIQNTFYGLPHVPGTAWQLRFGHLVGYGAKYYSYLVSRAVAQSIWTRIFAKDPLSRDAGFVYKRELLGVGGGKHPREIVETVLQTSVTPEFLADCVLNDVSTSLKSKCV